MNDILPMDDFQEALRKGILAQRIVERRCDWALRKALAEIDPASMPEDDPWSDDNAWRDGSIRTGINRYRRDRP